MWHLFGPHHADAGHEPHNEQQTQRDSQISMNENQPPTNPLHAASRLRRTRIIRAIRSTGGAVYEGVNELPPAIHSRLSFQTTRHWDPECTDDSGRSLG